MDCTIRVAKTKALISFALTAKLICVFVFAYAKSRFSDDAAHYVYIYRSINNRLTSEGCLCLYLSFISERLDCPKLHF